MDGDCKPRERPAAVFDLDETLIFGSSIRPQGECLTIRIGRRRVYVKTRPGLPLFLKSVKGFFDVYFFTYSTPAYANAVIDSIAPDTPQDHRLFREDCVSHSGYPLKDLRLLHRPLHRLVMVDDVEGSALMHPKNLVRIGPWLGQDEDDSVLMKELWPLLKAVAGENDLPAAVVKHFSQNSYTELFISHFVESGQSGRNSVQLYRPSLNTI
jgi:CTD small phosphatase-like protein 2